MDDHGTHGSNGEWTVACFAPSRICESNGVDGELRLDHPQAQERNSKRDASDSSFRSTDL